MRSLVESRTDRLALVSDPHPRFGELQALLARAALEVTVFPRLLADARVCPPPDVILVPASRAPRVLPELAAHPVLRWSLTIVVPWDALDDGTGDPLRVDALLRRVRAGLAERRAACALLAEGRRAVSPITPLGPLPILFAAARTTGTTLILEEAGARARLSFAHGRYVGGRATDAAQLLTVTGIEALAFALRLEDAEVIVVRDEEDEPLGEPIEDAVRLALSSAPRIEVFRPALRAPVGAPITLEIPERLARDGAADETGPFRALEASPKGTVVTRRYPAIVRREAGELRDVTRLWHRPIAREVRAGSAASAPESDAAVEALEDGAPEIEILIEAEEPVFELSRHRGDPTFLVQQPSLAPRPATLPSRASRGALLAGLALPTVAAALSWLAASR